MKRTLVLNDLHVGVQRATGTTFSSADALRDFAMDRYDLLLGLAPVHRCKRVVVNGDLTDAHDIPLSQALELYMRSASFLRANPDIEMDWALGNHDLSKDSSKLGTVAFVGSLLAQQFPNFRLVDAPQMIDEGVYVIPHLINQVAFDEAVAEIPEDARWVLLHCNYDNTFACAADHSLNLSREQAKLIKKGGAKVVLGHEHQGREMLSGGVLIVGNQFPTSVADCLSHGDAQSDGTKRALILDGDSHEFITTWTPDDADGWFAKVDWRELKEVEEEGRGFVRVEGDVSATESTEAIRAIATFRQRSQSFVVTNATKVEQSSSLDDLAQSIEDVRSVDVIELLLAELEPIQQQAIRNLLESKKDE